jgi:hypothetical protein
VTNQTYYLAITRARDNTVTNATLSIIDLTLDDGRGLHSSTSQLNLSPSCHKNTP